MTYVLIPFNKLASFPNIGNEAKLSGIIGSKLLEINSYSSIISVNLI